MKKLKTVIVLVVFLVATVVVLLGISLAAVNIEWQHTGVDAGLPLDYGLATVKGSEILRPINEYADTADIVVRGVPVSRITTRKQLPPRYDWEWPENDPRNIPYFMIFDTVQFEVAEYMKGDGADVTSIFDIGTGDLDDIGLPQLMDGKEYVLFLYRPDEDDTIFWGDGYL